MPDSERRFRWPGFVRYWKIIKARIAALFGVVLVVFTCVATTKIKLRTLDTMSEIGSSTLSSSTKNFALSTTFQPRRVVIRGDFSGIGEACTYHRLRRDRPNAFCPLG